MRRFLTAALALLLLASAPGYTAPGPANPAPSLVVLPNTVITLTWSQVTQYTNETPIPAAQAANQGYKLYSTNNVPTTGVWGFIGYVGGPTKFSTQRTMTAVGTYCYDFTTVVYNPNAKESAHSVPICIQVVSSKPPVVPTPSAPAQVCVAPVITATAKPAN